MFKQIILAWWITQFNQYIFHFSVEEKEHMFNFFFFTIIQNISKFIQDIFFRIKKNIYLKKKLNNKRKNQNEDVFIKME